MKGIHWVFGYFFLPSIFSISLLCSPVESRAQLNLKVGYAAHLLNPEYNNALLNAHTASREYTSGFNELKYLHGLVSGFRYRFESTAVELTYAYQVNLLSAEGREENTRFNNELNYNIHSLSAGWEAFFSNFGIGATLDYNLLRIRSVFERPAIDERIRDNALSSTIFLSYNLSGKSFTGVSFKPFVKFYWTDFDLADLNELLSAQVSADGLRNDFFSYGISLIIYNGPQE